jgi:hypothetical protein
MIRARSIRLFLLCLTPITLWLFWFFLLYGAQTLACVPPIGAPRTPTWVALTVTSVAIAAVTAVFAVRRARLTSERDEVIRFLAKTGVDLAGLAALATGWIILVASTIPWCALPS